MSCFAAKMRLIMLMLAVVLCFADGNEIKENEISQARGKGKYALLINLAIVLAAKVGLYKIFLAITFVVAAIKAMVVMAWTLAIYRYVPNTWPHRKTTGFPDYHDRVQPPSTLFLDAILNNINVHFFYVVATKLFILKIVYGAIFYVVVYKAWHLVLWLLKYLKENKHHHYVEYDHAPVYDHGHDHDFGHDHFVHEHSHAPYGGYDKPVYGRIDNSHKKKVYDADGSYSVQS